MKNLSRSRKNRTAALVLAAALIVLIAAFIPAQTALAQTATGSVTSGALNVRSGPSAGYPIVATVYQGDVVTLLGRSSNSSYLYIRTALGTVGWASSQFIANSVPLNTLPVQAPAELSGEITGTVSLRTGPGVTYDRIGVLQPLDKVGILARNADTTWVFVRLASGQTGWMSSGFVNADASFLDLPVSTSGTVPVFTGSIAGGIAGTSTDFQRIGAGPRNTSATVTFIDNGAKVQALARNEAGDWVYVLFNEDSLGWATRSTFDFKTDPLTLPVVAEGDVPTGEGLDDAVLASVGVTVATLPAVISTTPPTTTLPPLSLTTATSANATSKQFLRFGTGPRNESTTVTFLDGGQSVTLLGRNEAGDWLYVFFNGDSLGWSEATNFTTAIDVMTLPLRKEGIDPVGEHLSAATLASVGAGTGGFTTGGSVVIVPGVPSPGAPTTVFGTGTVNAGALNVHPQPDHNSAIINRLDGGSTVNLVACNTGCFWLYVGLPTGGYGWVNSEFITTAFNIYTLPKTTAVIGTDMYGLAEITTPVLNVRSGDNTSYPSLGTVRDGEIVNLLGRNADSSWVVIRSLTGLQGWVASGQIELRVPFTALPVLTPPPIDTYGTAQVIVPALNVRSGPSAAATSLAVVYKDQQMSILGRDVTGVWLKVRLANGTVGWVNNGNVSVDVSFNSLPVLAS